MYYDSSLVSSTEQDGGGRRKSEEKDQKQKQKHKRGQYCTQANSIPIEHCFSKEQERFCRYKLLEWNRQYHTTAMAVHESRKEKYYYEKKP